MKGVKLTYLGKTKKLSNVKDYATLLQSAQRAY
jgi:hypothetical protein